MLKYYMKVMNENYKRRVNGNFEDCMKDVFKNLYKFCDTREDD